MVRLWLIVFLSGSSANKKIDWIFCFSSKGEKKTLEQPPSLAFVLKISAKTPTAAVNGSEANQCVYTVEALHSLKQT